MQWHQFAYRRRLQRLKKQPNPEALRQLADQIQASIAVRQARVANMPKIDYPPLPVSEQKEQIAEAIAKHQVVILAGETGSGKTTQLPKICMQLGRGVAGMIGHTQPRRLAARSVANRIAEELKTPLGQQVGFKIRFSDQVSDSSYVKLMTDGILLAEIQQDRFLNQYDTLIIDEAHERSLNIDFILGYLKQLLPKRPDLKLIITSATIDPERFSRHFSDAPILTVSGRTYPVEVRYRPLNEGEQNRDQIQGIIDGVHELVREGQGDILVFLSGEREIRDTADALQKENLRHTQIVPLYARLSASEQNRIFQPHSGRRIVLATNVAETSLTVPGIKYVIDPGLARISRYSYRSKVQRLPIEAISQASANQRAGRCGRVSEGICLRLYDESDYQGRAEFTDPEILRTNLASVIIQMLSLGLGDMAAFPFVQPPDNRSINDGIRLLQELGAVKQQKGQLKLTAIGRQMARLPLDPRYSRMLIAAKAFDALHEVMVIAAGLSIQDPRERPSDKRQAADEKHAEYADKSSDFISLLNLWRLFKQQQQALSNNQLRKWCHSQFINYLRMREWQDIVSQLKKSIAELGFRISSNEADYQAIHQSLLSGLLSHLGFKDKDREYLGARNSRFMLFPGTPLAKGGAKWLMVAELIETSRLYARMAAKIESQWVEPLAAHLVKKSYAEPHWSKKRGAVQAFESVTLYGLTLVAQRRIDYSHIDPALCRELFVQQALVNGDCRLNYAFLKHNQQAVAEVETLEHKSRRRDILVDEQLLVDFYLQKIPEGVCTEAGFKKWWQKISQQQPQLLHFDPQALLQQSADKVTALHYPDHWLQGNLTLPLSYEFEPKAEDDGVSLLIPLPLLNQVQAYGFDWLVPGLRHELIVNLIKSLPKKLRRNFVPAPDYADACLQDMSMTDKQGQPQALITALSLKLQKMTGVLVEADEWQQDQLLPHLRFNFKVLDHKQTLLAQGRDLQALKHALSDVVSKTLKEVATPELERYGLTDWDFEQLPKEFVNKRGGFEVKAYPALSAEQKSVAIKLFDIPGQAKQAHQLGLRALLKHKLPSPLKHLQENLPNKAKLGLYFNPFGQIKALIDDCIDAALDHQLIDFQQQLQGDIRQKDDFNRCYQWVRAEINPLVLDIAKKVEQGLTKAHSIEKQMKGKIPLNMISAYGDIQAHFSTLVYKGFVTDIGVNRLDDWNRYLSALQKRLEKLPIDPAKDRLHQVNVDKIQQQYQSLLNAIPSSQPVPENLKQVRWMLEELRVSFFAQQLGTKMPISAKRISQHLQSL